MEKTGLKRQSILHTWPVYGCLYSPRPHSDTYHRKANVRGKASVNFVCVHEILTAEQFPKYNR